MKSWEYKLTSISFSIKATESETDIIEDILIEYEKTLGSNSFAIDSIDYWDGLCDISIYFSEGCEEDPNQIVENIMNHINSKFPKFSKDNLYKLIGEKVRIIGGKYDSFEGILAIYPSYVENSKEKMLLFDKSIHGDDRVSVINTKYVLGAEPI